MKTLFKKSALVLSAVVVGAATLLVGGAKAASKPYIRSIDDETLNSVVLPLHSNKYKNESMTVNVRILDSVTGNLMFQTFHVRFNSNGNKNITVTGLMPSTSYSFRTKEHKRGDGDFSRYSNSRSATTLN